MPSDVVAEDLGEDPGKISSRVVAWDNTALAMQAKKLRPVNGLFWGEPQVARLRWKCTGTPTAMNKHDYPTGYKVVRDKKGEYQVQCDCIVIITGRKAEERTQAELEVVTSYVDLFGIDSSQSQRSDDPPSPPHRRKKRRSEDRENSRHAVASDIDDDDDGGSVRVITSGGNKYIIT